MNKFQHINENELYYGICKLNSKDKNVIYKNPHCAEFFCHLNNVLDCTKCNAFLKSKHVMTSSKKKKFKQNLHNKSKTTEQNPHDSSDSDTEKSSYSNSCKEHCTNGLIYDFAAEEWDINRTNKSVVDKYKTATSFYQDKFVYTYNEIPYLFDSEPTIPKPKSVIHWGQLKMFLVTILFLINKINPNDKEVHIIYLGSARGDNILILCDMFPNTLWYLIDPAPHHPKLKDHKQVVEIKTEFFTDDLAKYYFKKFANRKFPLLILSDIRVETDDKAIIDNQESNAIWHNIIKPDHSYFKFRCPYNEGKEYDYYDGKLYIQPYARVSSSETRIMFDTIITKKKYDCSEYFGKFTYFNRILRPSYYKKAIIPNNKYFDHCYDCTYFSYLISNYLKKFNKFNPFGTTVVFDIMRKITNIITKLTVDRIWQQNKLIRNNLI
jgi:hypothetical protein